MHKLIEYDYPANRIVIGFCFIVFAAMSCLFVAIAATNDSPAFFDKSVEFQVYQMTFIYAACSLFFLVITIVVLIGFVRSFGILAKLVLKPTAIEGPKSWISTKLITITYAQVRKVTVRKTHFLDYLIIEGGSGKLEIERTRLSRSDFDDLCRIVALRSGQEINYTY